ncbi:MAG: leucine-rich repeat protein [Clostridia bacterium]|nr:leucine-rich repeat protein [Clostridia bacterium]
MIRKILTALSLVILITLCMTVNVSAKVYRGGCGEGVSYKLDSVSGVLRISGNGDMYDFDDPIADIPWYEEMKYIKSVIIEDGVTSIGTNAFAYTGNITSVKMADSVTKIGNNAFDHCEKITSITLSNSLTTIGSGAFYGCSGLSSVTIPDGVTSIGNHAFADCAALARVDIPSSVTSIGNGAFMGCKRLMTVTLPDSVSVIKAGTFSGCTELCYMEIPEGVTSIEGEAFSYCTSLIEFSIPSNVKSMGDYVFRGCTKLTSVIISAETTKWGEGAFLSCRELISAGPIGSGCNIEYGWTDTIPENVFDTHVDLNSVTIHDGIKKIGNDAFHGCGRLKTVTFCGEAPEIGNKAFYNVKASAYYPACSQTWDESRLSDFGENITWIAVESEHTYTQSVLKEATCTEKGLIQYVCYCGKGNRTEETDALGHDFANKWTVDTEATNTSAGKKSRHCSRCSEVTDVIELVKLKDSAELFKDLSVNSWSKSGIDFVVTSGYMNGVSADKFDQTGTMTRAMIVSVLWRIAGSPDTEGDNPFVDLEENQTWYHNAVIWAYENGIVSGTGAETFSPTGAVTREQMATFLYRYACHVGVDTSNKADLSVFPDESSVGSWAKDALSWANSEGLITGAKGNDGITRLMPQGNATREQVATILMRFCLAFDS